MLQPDSLLNDRYRVVALIGQGGMGAVYEAIDERLRSRVALKQTTVAGEGMGRAFEREAQILAGLRHPALPRVIDHFVTAEGQFLVMEFFAGADLAARMSEQDGPLPVPQVLAWGDQLLDALDYLHTQEPPVVHRDIKPQNMKLTPRGEIVLLDFGLAKGSAALPSGQSQAASLFGYTPQYAPLEQVQGTGTDPRSDLYSLGGTLYHLLTGKPPADALARAHAVLNAQPDPLVPANALRPELSSAVSGALSQSLALNAAARFGSAKAMRRALQSAAAEEAAVATLPAPPVVARAPLQTAATTIRQRVDSPPVAPQPEALRLPPASPTRVQPERYGPPMPLIVGLFIALLVIGTAIWFVFRPQPEAQVAATAAPAGGPTTGGQPASTADPRENEATAPEGAPVTVAQEVLRLQDEIASPGEQDAYSFEAEAGRQLFIWTASYDPGMEQVDVRLLDGSGDEVASQCLGCGNMGAQPLRAGGQYTIVVGDTSDPATGAYELRLNLIPAPLSFDVPLDFRAAEGSPGAGAGTIMLPGAMQEFRLEAEPGQQLFIWTASYDPGMEQVDVRLLDGSGDEVASQCLGCGKMGAQPLRAGGQYTIVVGDTSEPATGAFDLRVSAVPAPQARDVQVPFRVDDGLIASPGATQEFRFEAAAGQEIFVTTLGYDPGMEQVDVRLLDGSGDEVASQCLGCGNMGVQPLRAGGQYTVVVGDTGDPATGAYQIEVTAVP
jgi:hypothetical protein